MKKDGILGTKIYAGKTVEHLNKQVVEDYELAKDNLETLLEFAFTAMKKDSDNILIVLPSAKAILDTTLKNTANLSQLISINTKVSASEKEENVDDFSMSVRQLMKDRGQINQEAGIA